jgi:hypothetical protein
MASFPDRSAAKEKTGGGVARRLGVSLDLLSRRRGMHHAFGLLQAAVHDEI